MEKNTACIDLAEYLDLVNLKKEVFNNKNVVVGRHYINNTDYRITYYTKENIIQQMGNRIAYLDKEIDKVTNYYYQENRAIKTIQRFGFWELIKIKYFTKKDQ